MKRLMILAALLVATTAQANNADDCKGYATIATGVLEMRQGGAAKRDIVAQFEELGIYNQVVELAVIRAFKADPEAEPEDFRASTFKRCRANEL